jgi:hypothetical protein
VVKPVKYFLKQAAKAEAAAQREPDEEMSESLLAMARGYRSQAEILKAKQQQDKKSQLCG